MTALSSNFWAGLFVGLFSTIAAAVSRAEIIAADDFEYDTPTIRECKGGIGWADAWTGGNLISAGSLSFPDYDAKGNHITTLGDMQGKSDALKCSVRTPDTRGREHLTVEGKFGKPGTTLWVAFLASVPRGWDIRGAFAGVSLRDSGREQLFLGDCGSTNLWGFERAGELQRFSEVRADTNVTFLVYKIRFLPHGAQVEMWINPKPGSNEPPPADTVAAEVVREFRFSSVRICSAPASLNLDALRLGTTYADVAPASKKP
jgi:hypothetical protein